MEYTKVEQLEHRKQLVEALRSGRYSQGRSNLKQVMFSGEELYCVLGVACEESGLGKFDSPYFLQPIRVYQVGFATYSSSLPPQVQSYYGFRTQYASVRRGKNLMHYNDSGVSFLDLALMIERGEVETVA